MRGRSAPPRAQRLRARLGGSWERVRPAGTSTCGCGRRRWGAVGSWPRPKHAEDGPHLTNTRRSYPSPFPASRGGGRPHPPTSSGPGARTHPRARCSNGWATAGRPSSDQRGGCSSHRRHRMWRGRSSRLQGRADRCLAAKGGVPRQAGDDRQRSGQGLAQGTTHSCRCCHSGAGSATSCCSGGRRSRCSGRSMSGARARRTWRCRRGSWWCRRTSSRWVRACSRSLRAMGPDGGARRLGAAKPRWQSGSLAAGSGLTAQGARMLHGDWQRRAQAQPAHALPAHRRSSRCCCLARSATRRWTSCGRRCRRGSSCCPRGRWRRRRLTSHPRCLCTLGTRHAVKAGCAVGHECKGMASGGAWSWRRHHITSASTPCVGLPWQALRPQHSRGMRGSQRHQVRSLRTH